MEPNTEKIKADLRAISEDAKAAFGGLDANSLNWKPSAESWSVAQCLDHLILTSTELGPAIDRKLKGEEPTFFEKYSPFTSYFGRWIKSRLAQDAKRSKAPSKSIVPPSEVGGDIVERFCAENERLIAKMDEIGKLDWDKTVLTSPFLKILTYDLRDGLDILVEHEKRHIRQAKRVMNASGFPRQAAG
ncbi:MAG: DinB superfamily protein [Acidobacteria bacterium OLB17]|nr:MAG: DinB superfamily protein [Acidobacteria bacterium OLB17]MCZ2391129.1 DinB family protein [Acidobacteriota bacterium]